MQCLASSATCSRAYRYNPEPRHVFDRFNNRVCAVVYNIQVIPFLQSSVSSQGSGKAGICVGGMSSSVMRDMGGRVRCLPSMRSRMFLAASCMRFGICFQLMSCKRRCITPSSPCVHTGSNHYPETTDCWHNPDALCLGRWTHELQQSHPVPGALAALKLLC